MQREILQRQNYIDSLENVLTVRSGFSDEAVKLAPEVKILFPQIEDIALSNMVLAGVDRAATDTVNMVFVRVNDEMSTEQCQKLTQYIGTRLNRTNVHVSVNPHLFPWPSLDTIAPTGAVPSTVHDTIPKRN